MSASTLSRWRAWTSAFLLLLGSLPVRSRAADYAEAPLPPGVRAVWNLDKAHRDKTATRERVCLNGLWRWQPALLSPNKEDGAAPVDAWGFFKVPGFWPGAASYIQEDSQILHVHPNWKNADVRNL